MLSVLKADRSPGAVLTQLPIPEPAEREVLVKVTATSICGTDYHIYAWNEWAQSRLRLPKVMGHEFAGEVVGLGKGVRRAKVGDYVSAETHVVCGHCLQCMLNERHVCQNTRILGVDIDGCFAEYVVVPEENLWYNDPAMAPSVASIQEPLGNAVQTALSVETRGKSLAVFGCGPIGLMAVGVARAVGASCIVAVDVNDYRLGIAKAMGADLVVNSKEQDPVESILENTRGVGADAVLEMSGVPIVYEQMLKAVRPGGRIALLGLPAKPVCMDFSEAVVMRGITMLGITGRRIWDTWIAGRNLLESGRLDVEPIITHHFHLKDYEKGMELMASGNCGKVILYPGGVPECPN